MMVILQLIPEASPNIDTNRIESLSLASYFPVTMRFFFFIDSLNIRFIFLFYPASREQLNAIVLIIYEG